MKTTYTQQINAIRLSRLTLELGSPRDLALNDACSTIAAINLNPDIFNIVKQLEQSLGLTEIELSNKKIMLKACESALEKDRERINELTEALLEVRKHMTAHVPEKVFDRVDQLLNQQ